MKFLKIMSLMLFLSMFSPIMAQGFIDEPPPDGPPFGMGKEQREKMKERIETIKAWKLTEKLDLTATQAERFFPIYNKIQDDRMAIEDERQQLISQLEKLTSIDKPNETEIGKILDKLDNLDKRIYDNIILFRQQLKGIISTEQIGRLYVFELEFRQQMREIIRDAQGGGMRGGDKENSN